MMKQQKSFHIPVLLLLSFAALLTVFPFIWMLLTSLKTYEEAIRIPPQLVPEVWQWKNYQIIAAKFPFARLYLNTFIVVALVVGGNLAVCAMAAYAFARLHFAGRDVLFMLVLGLLMIPGQIFLVPHYQIITSWRLSNTLFALALPGIFRVFGVFFLRQAFLTIPKEMDEAALVDGCSYQIIFARILVPLVRSAMVSLGILIALWTWTDLMWPLIINRSLDKLTLSAGLAFLIGEHTTYYEQVMAGGVISSLPIIVIFIFFQRYIIEGIASTGVKG
ncbi:L-arabinose transport system permease protein AraQ [bioreactor metagenome]|uniref:L-arabinose transport system permease protein AraQ n=2 Tax=root TaxID=1 RepID=A0A644WAY3_9ZZZZ|nr:carbohydrate ABC transporter permease [Sphaerochaeta associata]MEA5030339.1 carbohydrate ABC transporter permease [Sphaerochaeta associata]